MATYAQFTGADGSKDFYQKNGDGTYSGIVDRDIYHQLSKGSLSYENLTSSGTVSGADLVVNGVPNTKQAPQIGANDPLNKNLKTEQVVGADGKVIDVLGNNGADGARQALINDGQAVAPSGTVANIDNNTRVIAPDSTAPNVQSQGSGYRGEDGKMYGPSPDYPAGGGGRTTPQKTNTGGSGTQTFMVNGKQIQAADQAAANVLYAKQYLGIDLGGSSGADANGTAGLSSSASTYDPSTLPSAHLEPGQSGPEVQALQNWLIKNGFSIPDGATGFYGPQTKAAVAALQGKLGVDGGQYAGFYGPKTKAALMNQKGESGGAGAVTQGGAPQDQGGAGSGGSGAGSGGSGGATDFFGSGAGAVTGGPIDIKATADAILSAYGIARPDPTQNPTSNFIDTYSAILKSLGIPDIKGEFDKVSKEFGDVQNELDGKVADINDDPWLTEGTRVARIAKLQDKYATKLDTLSNQAKLYQSMYENGTQQAQWVTTQTINAYHNDQTLTETAVNKAIDIATKKAEAEAKLDTQVVDVGGRKVLVNSKTGETVRDLGVSSTGSKLDTQVVEINGRKVLVDTQTGTTIRDLGAATGGGSSGSGTFSKSQLNNGAANAHMNYDEFGKLDYQTKNFFINNFSGVSSELNKFNAGTIKAADFAHYVQNMNTSDSIKQIIYDAAGVSPQVGGASASGGTGFWGGALQFVENLFGV